MSDRPTPMPVWFRAAVAAAFRQEVARRRIEARDRNDNREEDA